MDGRKIFDAINTCDDVFIKEVVLDMENRRKKQDRFKRLFFNKNQHLSGIRIAAAIVLFIAILGVGVKTTAHVSMLFPFGNWGFALAQCPSYRSISFLLLYYF